MIDRISGILAACDLTEIVVDVGGIGFALTVPLSTYDRLPAVGSSVQLFGHLHVREDQFVLYGFADPQERRLFRLLITVSGIGPRMALNVLSCMPITTFCQAVAEGDIKALTRISGFGKRSAERLVVELREKVSEIDRRSRQKVRRRAWAAAVPPSSVPPRKMLWRLLKRSVSAATRRARPCPNLQKNCRPRSRRQRNLFAVLYVILTRNLVRD